jgi:hypothetical protein
MSIQWRRCTSWTSRSVQCSSQYTLLSSNAFTPGQQCGSIFGEPSAARAGKLEHDEPGIKPHATKFSANTSGSICYTITRLSESSPIINPGEPWSDHPRIFPTGTFSKLQFAKYPSHKRVCTKPSSISLSSSCILPQNLRYSPAPPEWHPCPWQPVLRKQYR